MNRLKKLRNEAHVSLRQLSKYTHVADTVISLLENNKRPFRQQHINVLSSFFNVSADFLLGRTDNGYIVKPEYGDDEIILSEKEYQRLRQFIELEIVKLFNTATNVQIETTKEVIDINIPTHVVYRELKGTVNDYDLQETLLQKYNDLGKKMSSDDLKKTIKFIEDYIIK